MNYLARNLNWTEDSPYSKYSIVTDLTYREGYMEKMIETKLLAHQSIPKSLDLPDRAQQYADVSLNRLLAEHLKDKIPLLRKRFYTTQYGMIPLLWHVRDDHSVVLLSMDSEEHFLVTMYGIVDDECWYSFEASNSDSNVAYAVYERLCIE